MSYLWDPYKAETNFQKHGVHFADATAVFEDEFSLRREDKRDYDEPRYLVLGMSHIGRILVIVYTFREDDIRLISARPATRRERKTYEQNRFLNR